MKKPDDQHGIREGLAPGSALGADAATDISRGNVLDHPGGLFLLFFVEMWERFSYYGNRALLVLYFVAKVNVANPGRGWLKGDANLLYGWYTGLAYLLPLLGGILADKLLGTHRSMLLGGTLIALGHILLGITGFGGLESSDLGMSIFIGGLALIVIGTGYFKPCVSVMVAQLYKPEDPRRDGAFTIFYMGINAGAFFGAILCGYLGENYGWHFGFGAAAVGMLAGLFIYVWMRRDYLANIGLPPVGASNSAPWFLLGSLVVGALAIFAWQEGYFAMLRELSIPPWTKWALALATVVCSVIFVAIQKPGDKGPTATIFIFVLFNAFFWIAYEQAGSTLNVFAKDDTDRMIFGWEMPATWFQSLNPALIILLAPVFAAIWSALGRRGLDPSQPIKIGLALFLVGLGYVFIVIGAYYNINGAKVSSFWLLALYTCHTLGELCISPTGLSYVTKTAPIRFVSLLMGIWFIGNFLANLGGGLIASEIERFERGEVALPWHIGGRADFFMLFVVSSMGAGVVIIVLTPLFKLMMRPET